MPFFQDLFKRCGHTPLDDHYPYLEALGRPQEAFKSIHIAGTNGKGSVAFKLSKVLQARGYKVGLFTSPHLTSFCERIQVNGELIPEQEGIKRIQHLFNLEESIGKPLHFFSLITLLAFEWFRDQGVDIAIIETGVGGSVDATNVVTPVLSIITSIGMDHAEWIGPTLDDIAKSKAGIIKPNVPVVVGPKARNPHVESRSRELNAPLHQVDDVEGFYDLENQAIAAKALQVLSIKYEDLSMRPPCRFEEVEGAVLDGAHNEDGFRRLLEVLPKKPRIVLGLSRDKVTPEILHLLAARASHIHLTPYDSPRAASAQQLAAHLEGSYTIHTNVREAVEDAKKQLTDDETLVITGSFYIMSEARDALHRKYDESQL